MCDISPAGKEMTKAYSNDLRCRILEEYERGTGTEQELAQKFGVSLSYVKKIRRQQLRTGKKERVEHQPGRKPLLTEPIRELLRSWLTQQTNLTLGELQERLWQEMQLRVSRPSLWAALKKMGMPSKKSRLNSEIQDERKPETKQNVLGNCPTDLAGEADFHG